MIIPVKTKKLMKKNFTHLHVHTHYSLLDGLGKIDDLLEKAASFGMTSLAITDHGNMYGVPEFYEKATKKGIKPIIGCEFYLAPNGIQSKLPKIDDTRHHLILLARNNQGYKNLMQLVSIAHLEGFYYKPRIDLAVLKKYSEGLIGMTACVEGEIPSLILSNKFETAKKKALEYENILGKGNFYLEIQHLPNFEKQKIANQGLIKLAQETGLPLVATADVHYVNPEDAEVQDILICIQTNRKITDTNRLSMKENQLHLKSPEEMKEFFRNTPEALENTAKIAARCNVTIEFGNIKIPYFPVPENDTPESFLRKLCEQGLKKRFGENIQPEFRQRMDYELEIISKMGFAGYFLIVQDFVNWSKKQGIVVGPGRGSAAGSFVSYLTGITNIDPIKYDLLFERFLNPDRISMPDIDMDFADHRRDEVLDYVRQVYGADHVAQIITFGTMAARAAIRDAGRALGVEYAYCDKLAKMVPPFKTLKEALKISPELLKEYEKESNAQKIIRAASRLEGVARHASVHACGVVITHQPVVEYSPLQKMTGKENTSQIVTQYSASSKSSYVEKIGLLKMDFLGLKNLTIIEKTLKIIEKTTGEKIDIENLSLEDKKTYRLLQKGETTGVFQLESSGMKRYLKQLKPTNLEDLIAMVALYRPGPMEWIPDFIAGKHGRKKIEYLHPKLKPILEKTYGVAVYQEQVMQIARDIAGFSPGEADVLRKAMGKKIQELIAQEKKKFVQGCMENGLSKELGEKIFAFIEPFAGYGFNRSHAACYALIGYQTAYLKAHYPAQFMAALLNSDKDDLDRIAIEIEEARESGVAVLPPDINESFKDFAVIFNEKEPPKIRFGLVAIKGVGENIAEKIIEERKKRGPYSSVINLVERITDRDMNKKSLEALAKSGALDSLIERNQLLQNIEKILAYAKEYQKNSTAGQASLFAFNKTDQSATASDKEKITLEETSPANIRQRLSWEKELLGLYISDHPLKNYQRYFAAKALPLKNLSSQSNGQNVVVGGIIVKTQKIITRRNQLMNFVVIEDGTGKIEVLVFPKTLEQNPDLWQEEKIILVKGRVSDKDGEIKLICSEAFAVDEAEMEKFKSSKITSSPFLSPSRLPNAFTSSNKKPTNQPLEKRLILKIDHHFSKKDLPRISHLIKTAPPGIYSVCFLKNQKKLVTPYRIEITDSFLGQLENLLKKENIMLE